jgi:hypothetical protein
MNKEKILSILAGIPTTNSLYPLVMRVFDVINDDSVQLGFQGKDILRPVETIRIELEERLKHTDNNVQPIEGLVELIDNLKVAIGGIRIVYIRSLKPFNTIIYIYLDEVDNIIGIVIQYVLPEEIQILK